MHTLYRIAINNVGQYSVDVFSDRRETPNQWRSYFVVSLATIRRLRALYSRFPKRFYVTHEWSTARWRHFRDWRKTLLTGDKGENGGASLVSLETKNGGTLL